MNLAEDKLNTFKTVFLGDSSVGKTCLAKLFVEGEVVEKTTNTIGFDHHVKKVYTEEGVSVKVSIAMTMHAVSMLCTEVGSTTISCSTSIPCIINGSS